MVPAEIERFPVWPFDTRILPFFSISTLGQPVPAVAVDIFKEDLRHIAKVILGA